MRMRATTHLVVALQAPGRKVECQLLNEAWVTLRGATRVHDELEETRRESRSPQATDVRRHRLHEQMSVEATVGDESGRQRNDAHRHEARAHGTDVSTSVRAHAGSASQQACEHPQA